MDETPVRAVIMVEFVSDEQTGKEELERLFVSSLPLIDHIVRSVCRPYRMSAADVDDFNSQTKVHIIEGDYAVLRKFEKRSSLKGYLTTVVRRFLNDYRTHILGRWRPSAEATRLGADALRVERLLTRERLTRDEAFRAISLSSEPLSRQDFDRLADRIPMRQARPRVVAIGDLEQEPAIEADHVETRVSARDRASTASAIAIALAAALGDLNGEEQAILRMHFVADLSVAEIARSLQVEQKPLYRRIDSLFKKLRRQLVAAGVDKRQAAEIIGKPDVMLEFGLRSLGSSPVRPSMDVRGGPKPGGPFTP